MKTLLRYLAITLLLAAGHASADKPFVFTAIPDEDESKLQERFGQVAAYLQQELGVPVRYVPVKSYAATITAFRNNQVQLAWFGGLSGLRARELVPGSQALAQGVEDAAFKTYFIAHRDSGLTRADTLQDTLRGKTFTFGAKGSTSGRLMPEFYLRQQFRQAPEDVFSRVGFSGDHSRTIELVMSGAYQVGALNYTVWESAVAAGQVDTSQVAVIWETPTYPDYQWSIRGDVDAQFGKGFMDKVRAALLAMKDPALLAAFPRSGFIPASNSDYQPIADTVSAIGLIEE
ncbi:MAG: putative selenate ABC transporter substrate-binding protein [Gammaproteobacteria bacterium]|nr:MAG: putative selenate ABC transporter substrate-binding protein [Gammaproteobacteria bacterium]